MSQDYSRINFDPSDDYLGVLLQQGRPLTDADWNALVAQLNRRTQAGSLDTFGPAVVPEQTPDGFLITPVAGGFTIGRGRIYVDGLLAENHGAGARSWDPHLAEEYHPDPVPWNAQPYLPEPAAPPVFPYLVFVDVWQREVTELSEAFQTGRPETRRLIDVAVGVDTTQRLQTVWQVRTLGVEAGTDCATELDTIAAWNAATAASAGRLTTATGVVAGEPDPCLVPPLGGYKGGENQLYCVEVHTAGALGVAKFKWSRDNGSVQARVLTMPDPMRLVLDSIGKDDVLRFDDGDWIEITDDFRELNGLSGILVRIAPIGGVSDATRTLTLATPIPAGTFPVDAQFRPTDTRNTRVRKWDQSGQIKRADGTNYADVDATGGEILIPNDGSQILLENGILVSFSVAAAGGEFHRGDYWVFAARTNNASIEILDAAPPRGIHHHYAKLAVVTGDDVVDDCREIWPPDRGCCTKVVRPGMSIQNAIDTLPPTGGCVCLKSGVHEIDAPIQIARSNIVLHGEAPSVRVVTAQPMPYMLTINDKETVENVEVMHICFEYAQAPIEFKGVPILTIANCRRVRVHDCLLRYTDPLTVIDITGVMIADAEDCSVTECTIDRVTAGVGAGGATPGLLIAENVLRGLLDQEEEATALYAAIGIVLAEGSQGTVRANEISNFRIGVEAFGVTADIDGNRIRREAFPLELDNPTDAAELFYAIDVHGTQHARVHGNDVEVNSQSYGGVRAAGQYDQVSHNKIVSTFEKPSTIGPIGVFVGEFDDNPTGAGDFATLAENQLTGPQLAIYLRNTHGVGVHDNFIAGSERVGFGVTVEDSTECVVADNTMRDLTLAFVIHRGASPRILDNTAHTLHGAAFVRGTHGVEFDGNAFDDLSHMGILAFDLVESARFANSRIANCAYRATGLAVSLFVFDTSAAFSVIDVVIESLEVANTGVSPDGAEMTPGTAIGVLSLAISHLKIADNRIWHPLTSTLDTKNEHSALMLVGVPSLTLAFGKALYELSYGAALVTDNVFQGPAPIRLVDVRRRPIIDRRYYRIDFRFEKLTFASNRCDHTSANDEAITADLFGSHMIVSANQVKTPVGRYSFGFGNRDNVAAIGNFTTSDYTDVGTTVPTPYTDFNAFV